MFSKLDRVGLETEPTWYISRPLETGKWIHCPTHFLLWASFPKPFWSCWLKSKKSWIVLIPKHIDLSTAISSDWPHPSRLKIYFNVYRYHLVISYEQRKKSLKESHPLLPFTWQGFPFHGWWRIVLQCFQRSAGFHTRIKNQPSVERFICSSYVPKMWEHMHAVCLYACWLLGTAASS